MPRGYSRDLRERLLQAEASELPRREIAASPGVSEQSLTRWHCKQQRGDSLKIGGRTGAQRKVTIVKEAALHAQVAATPDTILTEPCAASMSRSKRTLIATEREVVARAAWNEQFAAVEPATLVFLDQTSTQTVFRAPGAGHLLTAW